MFFNTANNLLPHAHDTLVEEEQTFPLVGPKVIDQVRVHHYINHR